MYTLLCGGKPGVWSMVLTLSVGIRSACVRQGIVSRYMNQNSLEKEFIATFAQFGDAIFRFCLVKVSQTELAEDMTQEVFTRYWQSLRAQKEMTNTRSFLYTIANNIAKDWYKRKKAYSLDRGMESGHIGEPRANMASSETLSQYAEVLEVIEDMEQKDKEVLLLRYVEGFEPKEIGEVLGESANVISVRLNRAMERLKQKLHL